MITTIKEQINCMLNRKEQLDLDQWPMMIFFSFFLYINIMFGQLCICYVLVVRSFTKLLITTTVMKNTFIYSSEGKQKQIRQFYFTKHCFSPLVSIL